MRPLDQCRVASNRHSTRQVLVEVGKPGRRTGAVMLIDDSGRLTGLFTDSDLARLFEDRRESALDSPIQYVMTSHPATIRQRASLADAVQLLLELKISELPVVDENHPRTQGHNVGHIVAGENDCNPTLLVVLAQEPS